MPSKQSDVSTPPTTLQAFDWFYQHSGDPLWHHRARNQKAGSPQHSTLTAYLLNGHVAIIQAFSNPSSIRVFLPIAHTGNFHEAIPIIAMLTGLAPITSNHNPLLDAILKIRDYPANENSDPDVITEALEQIQEIAGTALLLHSKLNTPDHLNHAGEPQISDLSTDTPDSIICPHCQYDGQEPGNHGDGFHYLTDQTTFRQIVSIENGSVLVHGPSDTYPEDPEHNERIECRSCLKEFPLPQTLQVQFI